MRRTTGTLRAAGFGLALGASLLSAPQAFAADLGSAEHALLQGHVAEAIASLRSVVTANQNDGPAHLLLCRAYYAEQLPDPAVSECEAALRTLGNSSEAQDWMGKAYGLKADRSGPLSGYGLAKKVKAAFEAAVKLDAANGEAVDDLGEYYVQAPGIVGGGIDKAEALATSVQARHPQRALRIQAMIAEKRKDYSTAERQFKARVESSGGRADTWLDLGNYYGRRHDADKAVEAFRNACNANRTKGPTLLGIAAGFVSVDRELPLAAKALQEYLGGGHLDDSAPAFKAHTLLAKLLANRGDKAAAKIELGKALALAPDYEPAKKALAAL